MLLLCVFSVVNVACIVLRRRRGPDAQSGRAFQSPRLLPYLAAVLSLYLVGPWVDRDPVVYQIAGGLMVLGVLLWILTYFINRAAHRQRGTPVGDSKIGEEDDLRPRPPGPLTPSATAGHKRPVPPRISGENGPSSDHWMQERGPGGSYLASFATIALRVAEGRMASKTRSLDGL